MNAIVSNALLNSRSPTDVIEYPDNSAQFVVSQQFACHYDHANAAVWSQWAPSGIPSFNIELLHDLERGSQMLENYFGGGKSDRPLRYIVLRSGVPGAFNLGG